MDNRLASLMQHGQDLTRAEYRVLAFIAEHASMVGKITVRELAQKTYVSTATIMRLCRKIGFSGYSEFIYHCKQLLTDNPRLSPAAAPLPADGHIPAAFQHFIDNYQRSFSYITTEDMAAFSRILRQESHFFLYGAGFSHLFAEYLAKKLQVLGKDAFSSGLGDSRGIFLNNAPKYQVFIAISRSGETEQVLDKARIARTIGMQVIAFTRASLNSLGELADLHFKLYDDAVHYAAEAGEISSFESNLVMLIDLLLLQATTADN
ncbi:MULTISPECIES: MurR/RpiR family transcriptional regulator [unclassified Brenneria]|uniref:MurR/RpiR family transcriptional regulator n=1 Tax=unclassified Brenneria TaxID=2634434 RepID=UPI0015554F69|nr:MULTISPECIES: MurR/RpiR family transcriptional regulator [unclassified Brenneria]MEE3645116.1 MurR/RpiR family transcriptional regulator [Brenneria sp. L3_3C_1]MEE3652759.1 MurR/RpiR family transcriptional regulator [Brenneria sp. HEZEL_4_2_4]MBJ7223871.1 MurR/RpiR family transcriptional regulator [Brenneria sp. L3-3C-1]MEE3652826.1 MurR/RpiR family transcriptional regulator [Brenneria sp. HEZEL_4_2_4]NPD02715.1 MurR/RpiR family transcriptional regulator [Brenneria sp. hezel4-2-4]